MQVVSESTNTWQMARETVKGEGFGGLYKGLLAPLVGQVPYNAL
jgi:hypothetical protein